MMQDRFVY